MTNETANILQSLDDHPGKYRTQALGNRGDRGIEGMEENAVYKIDSPQFEGDCQHSTRMEGTEDRERRVKGKRRLC